MENQNFDQENNLLGDYFFKISYKGQNYKISKEYKIWKKLMIEKYGKNKKEIICPYDNTIIYKIDEYNEEIKCPTCNSEFYNCIFCNKTEKNKTNHCCSKAYLKFKDEQVYNLLFTDERIEDYIVGDYVILILCSFFPFTSPFPLICKIINLLIVDFDEGDVTTIFYCILTPFALIMSVIYGFFYYGIFISYFVFSIPFKFYPLKIYFGLLIAKTSKY